MPPHTAVAQRFQRFLEEVGLDREAFAASVDGAISPHSLFSILNGHRRPSRALAVLIERSWGFRADFLLEGKGEMWTQPAYASASVGGAALSPVEATLVGFMRSSVENARAIDEQLEVAETWAHLVSHTSNAADELSAWGHSDSETDRAAYPLLARLLIEELQWLAEQHEHLITQLHRLKVHRLIDGMLDRHLRELPGPAATGEQASRLTALLGSLRSHRAEIRKGLEQALEQSRWSLESLGDSEETARLVRTRIERLQQYRDGVARLAELAQSQDAAQAREIAATLAAYDRDTDLAFKWLERVIGELSYTAPDSPRGVGPDSREALRSRFDAILEGYAA